MKTIMNLWFLAILISLPTSVYSANETAADIAMAAVDATFSELERQIIEGYYEEKAAVMKNDRQKNKSDDDEDNDQDDVAKKEKKDKKL